MRRPAAGVRRRGAADRASGGPGDGGGFSIRSPPRRRSSSSASSSSSSSCSPSGSTCGPTRSGTGASASTRSSGPGSGSRPGCSPLGRVVALIVLLGNVWLAGRLAPAGGAGAVGGGTLRSWIDRLNEAAANADPGRSERSQWERWNRSSTAARRRMSPRSSCRIRCRSAGSRSSCVAVLAALGVAGTVAGSWETIVALAAPGPVRPERDARRRPDLPPRHLVLPVRPAVPAPRSRRSPAGCSIAVADRRRRALPALGNGRRVRLRHPRPGPPRRPGRAVPDVDRPRLPARQARARPQQPGHRDRGQLHRRERPVRRLQRPDRACRRSPPRSSSAAPSPASCGRSG